ncbi:Uncharacterised protein [Brucella intermedia]|nr:Uncharacterised protein [Brucella intermedia]
MKIKVWGEERVEAEGFEPTAFYPGPPLGRAIISITSFCYASEMKNAIVGRRAIGFPLE